MVVAIIKCPECGRDVSDKAPTCPGCGAPVSAVEQPETPVTVNQPVRVVRAGFRWELIGAVGVIAAVVMWIAGVGQAAVVVGLAGLVVFFVGRAIN